MADRETLLRLANAAVARYQAMPSVISAEIVGSLRRGVPNPGDVDLLVVSDDPDSITLLPPEAKKELGVFGYADTFVVRPQSYGAAVVRCCGPKPFCNFLRSQARSQGMVLGKVDLTRGGKTVPTPTEESFFAAIALDFIPLGKRCTTTPPTPSPTPR